MHETLSNLDESEQLWLSGGSALPLVRALREHDHAEAAAAVCRIALSLPDCQDSAELESELESLGAPPPGWCDALKEFAANPSVRRWDWLMRFTPAEVYYHRKRNALRVLRGLGVDARILFQCATRNGITPEAIEFVEEGRVPTDVILECAESSGAKAFYFGLAAEASFLKGDVVNTVGLLKQAMLHEDDLCTALPHIVFIRDNATEEFNDALDRAGVPRGPGAA
jgi:hypothetical protein